MTHGSLFSGIGGFDLAAQQVGWKNVFHCEWNPFGQKILKYYWPNAISYEDITKTDFSIHRGTIDILTGGFPCQPYSLAGQRKGKEDERHLWPHMLRAIREIEPRWVVGENVLGLVGWNGGLVFEEVQADLEAEGYEVQPYILPACSQNAPHKRERVWFVAYASNNNRRSAQSNWFEKSKQFQCKPSGFGIQQFTANPTGPGLEISRQSRIREFSKKVRERMDNRPQQLSPDAPYSDQLNGDLSGFCSSAVSQQQKASIQQYITSNTNCHQRCERGMYPKRSKKAKRHVGSCDAFSYERRGWQNFPTQPPICDGNDGISSRLDGITFSKWRNESIKAGGNAIVPQLAVQIFETIIKYEKLNP